MISSDMRDWNPPAEDYADILVSELLGSFGDNELRSEELRVDTPKESKDGKKSLK